MRSTLPVASITAGRQSPQAHASLELTRATLDTISQGTTTFPEAVTAGTIRVTGDAAKLGELMALLDTFQRMFEIVAPKAVLAT